LAFLKNAQARRIIIEQNEGADDRAARQEIATLIFLKGARASADEMARPLLAEMKLYTDTANFLRFCKTFSTGLKQIEHAVRQFHVGTSVNALVATVAVPAWHIEDDDLALVVSVMVRTSRCSGVPVFGQTGLGLIIVLLLKRQQQELRHGIGPELDVKRSSSGGDVVDILPEPIVGIGGQGFIKV
jgi:hypothetical protein